MTNIVGDCLMRTNSKNNLKYITDIFRKDSMPVKVYNELLLHEHISQKKLCEKLNCNSATISSVLSKLRRKGFISYIGVRGDLKWIKHPITDPMDPPQDDIISRKSKAVVKTPEQLISEIENEFKIITEQLTQLKQMVLKIDSNEFVKFGKIGEEIVYRKMDHQ